MKIKYAFICTILLFFALVVFLNNKKETENNCNELLVEEWLNELKLASEVNQSYNNFELLQPEITNKKNVLIYRYQYGMCHSCIAKDLSLLNDLKLLLGKDNILILPLCEIDNRMNRIALKEELKSFNFKVIQNKDLLIPVDMFGFQRRYFALINNSKYINMIFFPRNEDNERFRLYFSEVSKVICPVRESQPQGKPIGGEGLN
jgi:hypothetical protein